MRLCVKKKIQFVDGSKLLKIETVESGISAFPLPLLVARLPRGAVFALFRLASNYLKAIFLTSNMIRTAARMSSDAASA